MLPTSFVHRSAATRLVLRDGAIDDLRVELGALGIRRPLLLGSARMQRSALFARVVLALGDLPHTLAEPVPAHSSLSLVERLAA